MKIGKCEVELKMFSENELLAYLIAKNKISEAPSKIELYTEHKEITLGIGNNHVAQLIISKEALEALQMIIEK